jgi:hypothetical protein
MGDQRGRRRPGGGASGGGGRPPQVGKRPSSPGFLLAVALAWLAAGAIAYLELHASWKLVPTVCFAGVGLLYLRGPQPPTSGEEGPGGSSSPPERSGGG